MFRQWRMAKGSITEACFDVAVGALKCTGTSGTANTGVIARAVRDTAMSLVMTFPAERGRLEAANLVTSGAENALFANVAKER